MFTFPVNKKHANSKISSVKEIDYLKQFFGEDFDSDTFKYFYEKYPELATLRANDHAAASASARDMESQLAIAEKRPTAQVQGLKNAGLSPLLAYDSLGFGSNASSVATAGSRPAPETDTTVKDITAIISSIVSVIGIVAALAAA